jgi:hypothetical protein
VKKLITFCQKLRIGQILAIFLVSFALLVTTACNSGDVRGARPNNPAVQAGGANNPYKLGGDDYTDYRMSADPEVKANVTESQRDRGALTQKNRADLQLLSGQLIAADIDSSASDLLYPGSDAVDTEDPAIGPDRGSSLQSDVDEFPKQRQPIMNPDPDANIPRRAGEAFKDSSSFLEDTLDQALERPEMQPNPATHK